MNWRNKLGIVGVGFLWSPAAWGQAPAAPPAAPLPAAPGAPDPAAAASGGLELREAPKPVLPSDEALTAHPGGLTSDEVARKAVAASPTIGSKQAEIDAANAKVDQAMIQFFPRLSLKATYARLSPYQISLGGGGAMLATTGPIPAGVDTTQICGTSGVTCVPTQTGGTLPTIPFQFSIPVVLDTWALSAQLAVPVSDYLLRLSKTMAATRANERATQLSKEAEALKAATDARIAYYNWTRGVAGVTVAESALVRIKALQKDTEAAFSVGAATKADVLRVEALAAATELTITDTRNMKQLIEQQMAMLMNEPVRAYQVGENIRAETPKARTGALPALVNEAYRRRVELRALGEADRSLVKAAEVVRVGEYPRLDAFGSFDYSRPNQRFMFDPNAWHYNWMVGVSLSWTVNDAFSNKANARELEANRRKLQYDVENVKRGLQMEVTSAYLDEQKARVALDTAQRGLKSAQEAYRVAVDLYRVGRATTTELIAAEQELLSASLREVNAAIDAKLATIRLDHATGRDAPNGGS